jgi:hypothetical protein
MNKRLAAVAIMLCGLPIVGFVQAQELMVNGDFETLEVEGEPPVPVRDAFGNAVPTHWFRSTNSPPAPVPLTELIGPENGDSATDSDGNGSYAAALNFDPGFAHSDWRSETFATTPDEELFWSFDFKVAEYVLDPVLNSQKVPEGFRIDLRSFQNADTSGTFAGEQSVYVYVHGYGPDTTGDGVGDSGGFAVGGDWPHPAANVTVINFLDNQWHTLDSDLLGDSDPLDDNNLWKIPANGNFTDVRVSVNAFNFVLTEDFQLLVDNVSVVRPSSITPTGDYNGNGLVDAADYTIWRDTFGQTVTNLGEGADGDASGTIDQGDYDFWKSQFGTAIPPGSGSLGALSVVPEPATSLTGLLALGFVLQFGSNRRRSICGV